MSVRQHDLVESAVQLLLAYLLQVHLWAPIVKVYLQHPISGFSDGPA